MDDYSFEINECERLTAEGDDKNEFVYFKRVIMGDVQKCKNVTKYEVTTQNIYEIMKIRG